MRSLLSPLLLLLIYERPGHGYDLIERLSRLGMTDVEPGHVYRVLRHLEQQRYVVSGWVTSGTGPARRRYELTEAGLAELDGWMSQLTQLDQVVGSCLARWADANGSGDLSQPSGDLSQPATARPGIGTARRKGRHAPPQAAWPLNGQLPHAGSA